MNFLERKCPAKLGLSHPFFSSKDPSKIHRESWRNPAAPCPRTKLVSTSQRSRFLSPLMLAASLDPWIFWIGCLHVIYMGLIFGNMKLIWDQYVWIVWINSSNSLTSNCWSNRLRSWCRQQKRENSEKFSHFLCRAMVSWETGSNLSV